jgi:fatty-acid desaturase
LVGAEEFRQQRATNLRLLAWLTGGASLHGNHHADPSSPTFSRGSFEFDPSWVVIRVLTAQRLVFLVGERVKLTLRPGPGAPSLSP